MYKTKNSGCTCSLLETVTDRVRTTEMKTKTQDAVGAPPLKNNLKIYWNVHCRGLEPGSVLGPPNTIPALPGAFVTSEDGNTLAPAGRFRQQCRRSQPATPPPLAVPVVRAVRKH